MLALVYALLWLTAPTSTYAQSCCESATGNLDCEEMSIPDIADLTILVDHLFLTFTPLCCEAEGNVDGSADGVIDIADLQALIENLFISFAETSPCDMERVVTDSTRLAIVRIVAPVADSLLRHSLHFGEDLRDFLSTIPRFEATGYDTATQSVWGRFVDGTLYVAVDNFAPSTDSGMSTLISSASTPPRVSSPPGMASIAKRTNTAPAGLPWSTSVRSLVTLDSTFRPGNEAIETMLQANGYTVVSRDASVDGLLHVGGDGVFYFMTHGGHAHLRYGRETFALETTTLCTESTVAVYHTGLETGSLAIMQVMDRARLTSQLRLAITTDFVIAHWNDFAPNAMVFINTGGILAPQGLSLREILFEKKASACFGWTGPIGADAANFVASFLFDRLLGANEIEPKETPAQRAFDYQHIYQDLVSRALHQYTPGDKTPGTTTFQVDAGPGDFGLLTPSIRRLSIDAHDVMSVTGFCGDNPGAAGRLLVNDTSLPVLSWEPGLIRVQLPDSGLGAVGPVAIEIDPRSNGGATPAIRRSNIVHLTAWEGSMTYTHTDLGTLKYTIDSDIRLRADLHPYRDEPHTVPLLPPVDVVGSLATSADISAAGTHTMTTGDSSITIKWSGGCTVPAAAIESADGQFVAGVFDAQNYLLNLRLSMNGADSCITATTLLNSGDSTHRFLTATIDSTIYDDKPGLIFHLPLEVNWDIQSGIRQSIVPSLVDPSKSMSIRLQWNTLSAQYPPHPDAPR